MQKFYGIGVKWGIGTTGMTGTGIATFQAQKTEFKRQAKKVEVADGAGDTAGVVYYDHQAKGTFTVKPSGATLAAAKNNNILPWPGTKMTVVDSSDVELNGDWLIDDASKSGSNTEPSEISIEATRYYNSAVMTEIAN